jgi:molybdopterin/thiamine biosynthesis adenylyltransferase
MTTILLIGAGGVASYLLSGLMKLYPKSIIYIIDKDILEERNLDRQVFSEADVGKPKAAALAELHRKTGTAKLMPVVQWFTESFVLPEGLSFIICAADNHEARHNAIQVGLRNDLNVYVGGNEYFDHEAFIMNNEIVAQGRSVYDRYPEIATDDTGSPLACQGPAQVAHPQLAVANFGCAAILLRLIWTYEFYLKTEEGLQFTPDQRKQHIPCEISNTLYGTAQV